MINIKPCHWACYKSAILASVTWFNTQIIQYSVYFRYHQYNSVSMREEWSDHYNPVCDCACKQLHLCAIQYIDNDPYEECKTQINDVTCGASMWGPSFTVILVFCIFSIFQPSCDVMVLRSCCNALY